MTAPALDVQDLVIKTLRNDAGVVALVGGVYDTVPANPWGALEGYISLGPCDMVPDDPDCIEGETHTVQVDVWSRKVGQVECKKICAAVKAALHLQPLEIINNAFCECELTLQQIMRDPDGLTMHGAMQFRITIEVAE
jgi:hypothetical protein